MPSSLRIGDVRRAGAIIVGSGIAGLSTALGIGDCVVVTRGKPGSAYPFRAKRREPEVPVR